MNMSLGMRKKLIVSGCSFTTERFNSLFHPAMNCNWPKWPALLGDMLDMDVINLGQSGSGNEFIFSSLMDTLITTDKEEIGLVIAAWSQCLRRDWQVNNRWTNVIIADKGDLNYHINKSMRYFYMFQTYCLSRDIPYKQLQMIEFVRKGVNTSSVLKERLDDEEMAPSYIKKSPYYKLIDSSRFIGYPMKSEIGGFNIQDRLTDNRSPELDSVFRLSEVDAHPSKIGHEMIAEFVYENL